MLFLVIGLIFILFILVEKLPFMAALHHIYTKKGFLDKKLRLLDSKAFCEGGKFRVYTS